MRSIDPDARERRNTGIDLVRGLLVLGIILGHFSELTGRQSFYTWLGTSFRMPLFIGLTGYMFNFEQARAMSLLALLRKYHRRLILPWLLACMVYITLAGDLDYWTPLSIVIWPPFHLWFVPVMMAFIIITTTSRSSPSAMLAIAIPASIAGMYAFGVGHITEVPDWMPDRRFFTYPIFFFFGLWIARRTLGLWKQGVAILLAAIGFLWWCRLHASPDLAGEVAAVLILGISLIVLLPCTRGMFVNLPPIASMGRQSLFYYLWHPLAFSLWASDGVAGLPLLVASLMTLFVARFILTRLPSISRLFGIALRTAPAPPATPKVQAL